MTDFVTITAKRSTLEAAIICLEAKGSDRTEPEHYREEYQVALEELNALLEDAPAEPVCTTCNGGGWEWEGTSSIRVPCPDCRPEHADGEPDYPLIDWRKANREQWERGIPGKVREAVFSVITAVPGRLDASDLVSLLRGTFDEHAIREAIWRLIDDKVINFTSELHIIPRRDAKPAVPKIKPTPNYGDAGTREVTKRDRDIAVKRDLINSTSPITFTPGMKAALNRQDQDCTIRTHTTTVHDLLHQPSVPADWPDDIVVLVVAVLPEGAEPVCEDTP